MIRSMTAFASVERAASYGTLACEVRAVNHRYLELSLRLPDELRVLEGALREAVAKRIARGKVDLGLRLRTSAGNGEVRLNVQLLDRLTELATDCAARLPNMQVEFTELLRYPGLIEQAEIDTEQLQADVLLLLDAVLNEFIAAREREGEKLRVGMLDRLGAIAEVVAQVRVWLPDIRAALRRKLDARLGDLRDSADPSRLEQELVLGLQKIDVEEELERLDTHISESRRVLALDDAVGRRLDFLLQEFNREANTLGSKSVDSRTTQAAVELKVLIEQIREQVQNIE
ncbi:MAG: YicC/YloC family endoribonuclease [Pseudomarimonas sp.]